jgi:hypothetical protein
MILSQHGDIIAMSWHVNIVNVLLFNKRKPNQLTEGWRISIIAQVVGWEKPDPTTKQVLQLGNPTPNVTSM